MLLRLAVISAFLASTVSTQDIRSEYPSRSTILGQADSIQSNASVVNHIRKHTQDRVVLGYITPWHPKGVTLAEEYRGKFDMISPTWHTADVTHTGGKTFYSVGGAPPGQAEIDWMRRMQNTAKDGNGQELPKVKILPRYVLDQFTPQDLVELLTDDKHMRSMTRSIIESVDEHGYDGVVFECAAVWAIDKLIAMIAAEVRNRGLMIVTVIPALRQDKDAEQARNITMGAMASLSPMVDHVMVMTYDHAGPTGRHYEDVFNVNELPTDSPLRQAGVRVPGPNTPLEYLTTNAEQLSAGLEMPSDEFVMQATQIRSVASKMLLGLPLYGYTYPVGWFDQQSSSQQSVARIPPSSPVASKDNDTEAQTASREKALKREKETSSVIPVLRFPGEPFKDADLADVLQEKKVLVRLDESSQEQYIDYVAKLPPTQQPNITEEERERLKQPAASYYRAYFPSAHTMKKRLQTIQDFPEMGVSIWELGMASRWLLDEL
jgi:chitinase domain-containing protein 1